MSPIFVEVSVDVSKTTLMPLSSNAEQTVRAEIETAFSQNPSLVDSLFSTATAAACSAQGIPSNFCPQPPSLALSLSSAGGTPPPQRETGNVIVPAVAGAIGGAAFGAAAVALLWWKAKSSRSKLRPSSDTPGPNTPGLVIRQIASASSADESRPDHSHLSAHTGSKRFEMRALFVPTGTR